MLVNLKVTCYIQCFFHPLWAISILYHYFSFEILRIRAKRTILNYWYSQWTLQWDQWILWYIQFHFLVQSSYLYSFWTFTEISNIWKDTSIHSDIHIKSVFFFVIPSLFYLEIILRNICLQVKLSTTSYEQSIQVICKQCRRLWCAYI